MFVIGWVIISVGSCLFLFGLLLHVRAWYVRIEASASTEVRRRRLLKVIPRRKFFFGTRAFETLNCGDRDRMTTDATAFTIEATALLASSAFLVSLGGILISLAR